MGNFYDCIICKNYEDFFEKISRLLHETSQRWIFRGQKDACWDLKTSLEREWLHFGIYGDDRFKREYNIVREFQRRLHYYQSSIPKRDNVDEWMALMQHYGAPTRFLDFTYSPYIALYFAFEKAESGKVAVWAIDVSCIVNRFKSEAQYKCLQKTYEKYQNYRDPAAFRALFLSNFKNEFVLPVNPFRLNDRLAYQQGVFISPASLRVGFMENLRASVNTRVDNSPVKKFIIEVGDGGENRDNALKVLQTMNINRISLFPGLVGFAESFKVGLMTVHDSHIVWDDGNEMRPEKLWQALSESTSMDT